MPAGLTGLESLSTVDGDLYVEYNTVLCAEEVGALAVRITDLKGEVYNVANHGECP